MKYLKLFNESLNQDWDLELIEDIFIDFLDEGFRLEDVKVGRSLSISPKLWCSSHHDFTGQSFASLSINIFSEWDNPKYDITILDVLDNCIKHFENHYHVKLDSIYTVGLPTKEGSWGRRTTYYNWFNSCQSIKDIANAFKDINPVSNDQLRLPISRFDLTFRI